MGEINSVGYGKVLDPNLQASALQANAYGQAAACAPSGNIDTRGDRSFLREHHAVIALAYRSDGTNWLLPRTSVKFLTAGQGDDGADAGLDGNLTYAQSSLLKDGWTSEASFFTIKSLGFEPLGLPFTPTSVANDNTASHEVTATGTTRNDCLGLARALFVAAMMGSSLSFKRTGREADYVMGTPDLYPAGYGQAANDGYGFGSPVRAARVALRRPIIVPPKGANADGFEFTLTFDSKVNVAPDPAFAVPAAGEDCVVLVRAIISGYYSDAEGNPIGGDEYETLVANS